MKNKRTIIVGLLYDYPTSRTLRYSSVSLRPVITINENVELSGDGTSLNPFTIKDN